MADVNKAILIGRLGADPELRTTTSGRPVASLRLATNEVWTDRDGKKQERTEWHRIVVWGPQAEQCAKYLTRGSLVYVEGRLQTREFERDGVTRQVTEINAAQVSFLSFKNGNGNAPEPSDTTSEDITPSPEPVVVSSQPPAPAVEPQAKSVTPRAVVKPKIQKATVPTPVADDDDTLPF